MLLPTAQYRGGYFPVSKPIQLVEQLAIRCSKGATRQARLDGFWYTRIIGLTRRSVYQKGSFLIRGGRRAKTIVRLNPRSLSQVVENGRLDVGHAREEDGTI